MNLTEFRSAFPAFADGVCFLDWAATGLLSDPARRYPMPGRSSIPSAKADSC